MGALRSETPTPAPDAVARRIAIDGDAAPPALIDGLRDEGLAAGAWGGELPPDGPAPAPDAVLLCARHGLPQRAARLREWRQRCADTPLVVLLAPLRELDHVLALEMGADDVLDAAWPPSVVAARLRACWRRAPARRDDVPALPDRLAFGALAIRHPDRSVLLAGRRVTLTESEFDLLWLLASHAGRTLSRQEIARSLGGPIAGENERHAGRAIDSCIYRLRGKLGDHGNAEPRIRTVRHRGYLFVAGAW